MRTIALIPLLQSCLLIASTLSAHAFYDPGVQRWLNRDPVAELGGINMYRFTKNNLVGKVDSLGLCERKTCKEICADFNKLKDAGATGPGHVICNGSEKCACYTPGPGDPAPGECPEFEKTIIDHESSHFEDLDCPGSNLNHQFPDFPTWKEGVNGDFSECKARLRTYDDLRRAIPTASSADCKKVMEDYAQKMLAWVMANCD